MERDNQVMMEEELEKIDLIGFLFELLNALKKFWIPVLILSMLGGIAGYVWSVRNYVPRYKAFSSLIIQAGTGYEDNYTNTLTANEMGNTFSYVATSGVLRKVVARDLGVDTINSSISADVMADSNLLTITVVDEDPDMAYTVLQSVINNYPYVAEYIVGPSTFTIIDDGGVPTRPMNGSGEKKNAMIGFLGVFALCSLVLMIYAKQRKTILQGDDLKEITNAKLLGNIPTTRMKKRSGNPVLLLDNPRIPSPFKESMRLVRSRLEKELRNTPNPVILVTSSIAGEGKTLFTVNLAIGLANKGSRVALVDGDLRHPSVAETLGLEGREMTIVSYLKGKCTAEDMRCTYSNEYLHVYPAGEKAGNPVSLIRSDRMEKLILDLKGKYDYVIIDSPPSALLSDAAGFAPVVDSAIFVVRQDYTSETQCRHALETITDAGIHLVGYIMNGVIEGTTGYGYSSYGYGAYGYRKYGYGYGYGYGSNHDEDKLFGRKQGDKSDKNDEAKEYVSSDESKQRLTSKEDNRNQEYESSAETQQMLMSNEEKADQAYMSADETEEILRSQEEAAVEIMDDGEETDTSSDQ